MNQILLFIIGIILGGGAVWFLLRNSASNKNEMAQIMQKRFEEKEDKKQKILNFIAQKGKITNDEAESLLGISDKTAERYFNELEKEGKIKQAGKIGRGVFYSKV